MTHLDARVDLLIVGSGPVGSAVARILTDQHPSMTVLMVDAGPRLTTPAGVNLKNLTAGGRLRALGLVERVGTGNVAAIGAGPGGGAQLVARGTDSIMRPGTHAATSPDGMTSVPAAASSTNVGGMAAHWTCATPRPRDSEVIPFLDTEDLDRAFVQAEALLQTTNHAFDDSVNQGRLLERLRRAYAGRAFATSIQAMPVACHIADGSRVWSGADTVLGDLAHGDVGSFTLRDRTLCQTLIMDGGRATGAVLRDLRTGAQTTVAAGAVFVAGDAFRTPQLLWASGLRPPALGRYFNDQPQILSAVTLGEDLDLEPVGDQSGEAGVAAGVFWVPFAGREHPFHGQVMHFDMSPARPGLSARDQRRPVVALSWFCAKDIHEMDRVQFSDSRVNGDGLPAFSLHHALTDRDLSAVGAAKDDQVRVAEQLGAFAEGAKPELMPSGSSLHFQGTTRMGPVDDGTSVCDTDSRVWGTENVFVGGNGTIPTATACNPTLTSVALAVLATGAIARQLG